jgi:hypothetical protein
VATSKTSLALALASIAVAIGLVSLPGNRAAADYQNISGEWRISFDAAPPCSATVVETPAPTNPYVLSMQLDCLFGPKLPGIIDTQTGSFHVYFNTEIDLEGNVSADKQTMSGIYYQQLNPGEPRTYGSFTGSMPPVGGVSVNATPGSGGAVGVWWLIAIAGASIVTLGGAALGTKSGRG